MINTDTFFKVSCINASIIKSFRGGLSPKGLIRPQSEWPLRGWFYTLCPIVIWWTLPSARKFWSRHLCRIKVQLGGWVILIRRYGVEIYPQQYLHGRGARSKGNRGTYRGSFQQSPEIHAMMEAPTFPYEYHDHPFEQHESKVWKQDTGVKEDQDSAYVNSIESSFQSTNYQMREFIRCKRRVSC